ncbi:hypothetical protein AB0B89_16970 [Sphaerisporangium sp. NPDC049002]|uniref:hypothetical protein n=1 Tax=Sphaerisporangium sp. NPDC049002 TaxID=3155392 RepID=UPI0033F5BC0F
MGPSSFHRALIGWEDLLARMTSGVHLRHRWTPVETIGYVVTQRCRTCDRTRVRVSAHADRNA